MSLKPEQHQQLHKALLQAFDNAELRRLVRFALDEDLDAIIGEGAREDRVFELIDTVERQYQIPELIAGAYNQNPTNEDLLRLITDARTWPACAGRGLTLWNGSAFVLAPRQTEIAYLDKLLADYGIWAERYTPLAGIAEVQSQEGAPALNLPDMFMPTGFEKLQEHGLGAERRVEHVPINDLREAAAASRRLVILGEPGSGKTTTLWRLVYDYAAAAQSDPGAPVPVFVPLGGYSGPEAALEYVAQFAGVLGAHLPAYIQCGRAVLLLDALNEMPRDGYKDRIGRIQALLHSANNSTVVVTCRALDYLETLKLEKVQIRPLDPIRQHQYLCRYLGPESGDKLFWQMAGAGATDLWEIWKKEGATVEQFWSMDKPPEAIYKATSSSHDELWRSLRKGSLPPLLALGVNPFLLIMTAKVYADGGELPHNRSKLVAAFVDTLLERERKRYEDDGWPGTDAVRDGLAALAFAVQAAGEHGTAVSEEWALAHLSELGGNVLYFGRSATILDAAADQVKFVHQLILEYFAALEWRTRLGSGGDQRGFWPNGWLEPSGWEETAILLAGMLTEMAPFVEALLPVHPALAARCIVGSGGVRPANAVIQKVQNALVALATSLAAPIKERNAAGNALNTLGDSRPGVGMRTDGLPDIIWCEVSGGPFLMGNTKVSDSMAFDDELPQHIVVLDAYSISRYPITNTQYHAFVEDGGYTEKWKHCWTPEGWDWRSDRQLSEREAGDFSLPNHPVVDVAWYEAAAFAKWLGLKLNRTVSLPTEAQWEKAARGIDGRRYPWPGELTPDHANYRSTQLRTTSAVGIFPKGASPYGVEDMAGNVWECTSSEYKAYPYEAADGREELHSQPMRVVRGGAFRYNEADLRCAARMRRSPNLAGSLLGFRVMLVPISE